MGILIVKLIAFLLASVFLFFSPGHLLIRHRKLTLPEIITLSFVAGLTLFTALSFFTYATNLRWLLLPALVILNLVSIFSFKLSGSFNKSLILIVLIGTIAQTSLIFPSNLPTTDGGRSFLNTPFVDSLWHIAVADQMQTNFPPLHPLYSGHIVTNYHYLINLLMAGINYLIPWFSAFDLYFQLLPTLISILFGLAAYSLGNRLGKSHKVGLLAAFLNYFASSLPSPSWHESSYWLIQPPSMLVNPHTGLAFLLFIAGLLAFYHRLPVITTLVWGELIGFKVYGGILVTAALGLTRKLKFFLPVLLISVFLFTYTTNRAQSLLVFSPGYFLRKLVEDPDRFPIPTWILQEEQFRLHQNTLRILLLRLQELALFIIGNFGLRLLLIIPILPLIWRRFKSNSLWQIMILVSLIGFTIPHLFIQQVQPVNTLQFAYYAFLVFNFLAAISLSRLRLIYIVPLLILASLTTFREMQLELPQKLIIDAPTIEVLNFLKKQPTGITVTLPNNLYTPAFAAKQTYYSAPYSLHVIGVDVKNRELRLNQFLQNPEEEFLRENNIRYIFLPNDYFEKMQSLGQVIFQNQTYFVAALF